MDCLFSFSLCYCKLFYFFFCVFLPNICYLKNLELSLKEQISLTFTFLNTCILAMIGLWWIITTKIVLVDGIGNLVHTYSSLYFVLMFLNLTAFQIFFLLFTIILKIKYKCKTSLKSIYYTNAWNINKIRSKAQRFMALTCWISDNSTYYFKTVTCRK